MVIRRINLITVDYIKDVNGEIVIFLNKDDLSSSISLGEAVSLRDHLIRTIEEIREKENENYS
jgi:hypothetical protein